MPEKRRLVAARPDPCDIRLAAYRLFAARGLTTSPPRNRATAGSPPLLLPHSHQEDCCSIRSARREAPRRCSNAPQHEAPCGAGPRYRGPRRSFQDSDSEQMARGDPGGARMLDKVTMLAQEDKTRLINSPPRECASIRARQPTRTSGASGLAAADFVFQMGRTALRTAPAVLVSEALQAVLNPRWHPRPRRSHETKRSRRDDRQSTT